MTQPSTLHYAILEGGLIQNDPGIPYFDLDILKSDRPGNDEAQDALSTWNDIMEFIVHQEPDPSAHEMLYDAKQRLEAFILQYGDTTTVEKYRTAHEDFDNRLSSPGIIPTDRIHLLWICPRCDVSQHQPLDDIATAGTMTCETCHKDMMLSEYTSVS